MKLRTLYITICLFIAACVNAENSFKPQITQAAFPGFNFAKSDAYEAVKLTDYEFKSTTGPSVTFNSCPQVTAYNENNIAQFDFFRFRLLRVSCVAIQKSLLAAGYREQFLPGSLNTQLIERMPATAIPLLSKTQRQHVANKTMAEAFNSANMTIDNDGVIRVETADDEFYYTLLATGDFNNDGIGDMLVRVEWYARHAHGKHVDLLVLTQKSKKGPVSIVWRFWKDS